MQVQLSTQEKLKDLRIEKGLTLEQLSAQVGLSSSALGKYESDDFKDISAYSIATLAKFYGVSTDYLIGLTETKNHPDTELSALHLDDDAIDILKNLGFNHRLLSELLCHKDFQKLMLDVEIYVDRIADMQVQNLNAILEAVRLTTMEQYTSGQDDLYTRTMELAEIKEEEYFSHVIAEDLTGILHDIRETHKTDSTTADEADNVKVIQEQIQAAMNFEGSDYEKKAKVFLNALAIDYDAISTEQFITLIDILKKSRHMKSPISQRGKATSHATRKKKKRK